MQIKYFLFPFLVLVVYAFSSEGASPPQQLTMERSFLETMSMRDLYGLVQSISQMGSACTQRFYIYCLTRVALPQVQRAIFQICAPKIVGNPNNLLRAQGQNPQVTVQMLNCIAGTLGDDYYLSEGEKNRQVETEICIKSAADTVPRYQYPRYY